MTTTVIENHSRYELNQLELCVLLEKSVYLPGEVLAGAVTLNVLTDRMLETIQSLQVTITGREIVRSGQQPPATAADLNTVLDRMTHDIPNKSISNTFVYLEQTMVVWKNENNTNKLAKGNHTFRFQHDLPVHLPPSFYYDNADGPEPMSVTMLYTVTAKINFILSVSESNLAKLKSSAGGNENTDELPPSTSSRATLTSANTDNLSYAVVPFLVISLTPEDQHEESTSIPTVHYLTNSGGGGAASNGEDGGEKTVSSKGSFCCGGAKGGTAGSEVSKDGANSLTGGNSRGDNKEDVKLLLFPYILLFEEEFTTTQKRFKRYNTNTAHRDSANSNNNNNNNSTLNESERSFQSLHNHSTESPMKKKNTEEAKTDNNNNNNNTHPLEKPLLLPVELYNSNIRMIVKNNMHRAKTILSRVVLRIKQEVEVMVPVQLTNSKGNNNASPSLNVDLYPHTKREYEKIIVEKQFEPSMPVKEGRSATFDLQQLFVDFSKRNDKHDEHFAVNQLRYYSDVLLYVLGEEQQKQNKTSATTLAEIKKEESLKVLPTIKTKYTNSYIVLEMELFFLDEKKNREYMKFISKKNVLSIVTSTDYVLFMEKKNQNGGKVNNEDYEPLAKRVPAEYTTVYINPDK